MKFHVAINAQSLIIFQWSNKYILKGLFRSFILLKNNVAQMTTSIAHENIQVLIAFLIVSGLMSAIATSISLLRWIHALAGARPKSAPKSIHIISASLQNLFPKSSLMFHHFGTKFLIFPNAFQLRPGPKFVFARNSLAVYKIVLYSSGTPL